MKYTTEISLHEAKNLLELGTDFEADLEALIRELNDVLVPQGVYKYYEIDTLDNATFIVHNKVFHCGTKICDALKGSTAVVIFGATVGDGVMALVNHYNKEYDFLKAYWCDKIANWTLDRVVENMKKDLAKHFVEENLKITSNWGPGYCGWDISEQRYLMELLSDEELKIKLSPSMLMHPIKSLSGVIGIGKQVKYKKSGCSDCNLSNCTYRSLKW